MATPVWRGSTGPNFRVTTGTLLLTDRSTLTDVYSGTKAVCDANILARGTFGTGARLGWVVTASKSEQSRGNEGTLTINWEAGGSSATIPLSCDEFDLQPVELYPRIERSPFFTGITTPTLAMAYQAVNGATPVARAEALNRINGLADVTQKALGQKLIAKLQNGEETFYQAGWRYVWTAYSYTLPSSTMGGVIQSPLGPLTGYFSGVSFIRLADGLQSSGVNGSAYKILRTWLAGPNGYWDSDIY